MANDQAWRRRALELIRADLHRSADTHMIRLALPQLPGVTIYLKDETTHPSGSLKHRLARSLFLYGLANGWIREGRQLIEASSGSTAISEAYFARLIGSPFAAVLPADTAKRKVEAIEAQGGRVYRVENAREVVPHCVELARTCGGLFLDQFTFAERAVDWRGNNNIAESMFEQMALEPHPVPAWIVVGAGTGGTSATVGRYIRYQPHLVEAVKLCVVDPEGSAFFPAFETGDMTKTGQASPVVEGIGRPRVEGSFMPDVIDRMIAVPDTASVAGCHWLERVLGRRCGPSTGTNIVGALTLAAEMIARGEQGSIVTLICDSGERYADTIYDAAWLKTKGVDILPWMQRFQALNDSGDWSAEGLAQAHR